MDAILSAFDREFKSLDASSRELLARLSHEQLFEKPKRLQNTLTMFSCGEYILRSAAMVEKTFGGITTRLWDDPFEWTLPEKLSDRTAILQYLDEVDETRLRGFLLFASDADLRRQMPAPQKLTPVIDILLKTLAMATHFQGRAFALFQVITNERPPRV